MLKSKDFTVHAPLDTDLAGQTVSSTAYPDLHKTNEANFFFKNDKKNTLDANLAGETVSSAAEEFIKQMN